MASSGHWCLSPELSNPFPNLAELLASVISFDSEFHRLRMSCGKESVFRQAPALPLGGHLASPQILLSGWDDCFVILVPVPHPVSVRKVRIKTHLHALAGLFHRLTECTEGYFGEPQGQH